MAREAETAKVSDQPKTQRAYAEIKRRIVSGRYRSGVHLSESMLARVHRSSRTPIREALSRLLQEGYVELTPKRGYAVTQITLPWVRNMCQVRRLLECHAAEQAALAATAQDIDRLEALAPCVYVAAQPQTYHRAMETNLQFHITVAETSRNPQLVELIRQCVIQMERVLSLGIDYKSFGEVNTAEHQRIVAAIRSGNGSRAKRAIARHLDHSHELLIDALVHGAMSNVIL